MSETAISGGRVGRNNKMMVTLAIFAVTACVMSTMLNKNLFTLTFKAIRRVDYRNVTILKKTFATPKDDARDITTLVDQPESTLEQRPPLSTLIGDNETNITGDVQFLLDFAFVGHAKTGTTKQLRWLSKHEQVQSYRHEVHSLRFGKPAQFVRLMYSLPSDRPYKHGYKSPNDIVYDEPRDALRTYWPKTKLIIGVRHPVRWFQSYYDFKLRQGYSYKMPPADQMVGPNLPIHVSFHDHLAMMGKTNLTDSIRLLGLPEETTTQPPRMENPVFLYDVSQPFDVNRTRAKQYWKDLSDFIGLSWPVKPPKPNEDSWTHHGNINICDEKYNELRGELMEIGKAASKWIRTYFIKLPDVTVSQPQHFKEILLTWLEDPCDSQESAQR